MSADGLSLDRRGPTAFLTLGRSATRNAIDGSMLLGLADACQAIAADGEVRAVVLSAVGDVFSSGWDWEDLVAGAPDPAAALRRRGLPGDPFGCLAGLPLPVVCALNGDALDAGLELALACDIRIAAEGARLGFPQTGMGLLPLAGGAQRLARLAGRGKAIEILLTGEPIDAREALRCGLVSAVAPRERLRAETEAIASRIAGRGPLATRYAKEAVSRGIDMPLEQALRFETDLTIILQTTEDRAEGVRAFLEKRKPDFKGM